MAWKIRKTAGNGVGQPPTITETAQSWTTGKEAIQETIDNMATELHAMVAASTPGDPFRIGKALVYNQPNNPAKERGAHLKHAAEGFDITWHIFEVP